MTMVVELDGVTKAYGEVRALDGVDLSIGRGEVVAILGPNGAGKTTLFEMVLGLGRPTSGTVSVLGGVPGSAVRRRTGAMLQSAGLPDQTTVAELVRLIGRAYPQALPVDEVLARTALADRADRTVTRLSGGERQRLLLALAIVSAPELLVLDEPTAAMDMASRRGFWERAQESVIDGATMVFATHDLAEADTFADRVVVLVHGRVVADASPAQLKDLVAGRVVRVRTDASQAELAEFGAIDRLEPDPDVDPGAGPPGSRAWRIHTSRAEDVLVPLVQRGRLVSDLLVSEADLSDAFAHLTGLDGPADDAPTAETAGATR